MKMVKRFACMVMTVFLLSVMTGCGATSEQWAYNHEPENKILELVSNGKAEYKGNGYTYTKDDSFIHLKDKSGNTTDIRYVMEGDEMLFYEASAYQDSHQSRRTAWRKLRTRHRHQRLHLCLRQGWTGY